MSWDTVFKIFECISLAAGLTAVFLYIYELRKNRVSKKPLQKFLYQFGQDEHIKDVQILYYSEYGLINNKALAAGLPYCFIEFKHPYQGKPYKIQSINVDIYLKLISTPEFRFYKK